MLTEGEIKYLVSLSDDKKMIVKPWNPKGLEIGNQVVKEIQSTVPNLEVILMGSMPLKIAGQEDIDISVFCVKVDQPNYIDKFITLFGEPSRRGKNATAWDFERDGFSVSVWLTDPTAESTKRQIQVFNLLKNNPDLLKEYEKIKLDAKDLSYKEYQIKKYEFYHRILDP